MVATFFWAGAAVGTAAGGGARIPDLLLAACSGSAGVVGSPLAAGAPVDEVWAEGGIIIPQSALSQAASRGHPHTLRVPSWLAVGSVGGASGVLPRPPPRPPPAPARWPGSRPGLEKMLHV